VACRRQFGHDEDKLVNSSKGFVSLSRGFIAFTETEIIQDLINFLFPQSPLPTQRALRADMSSTGSLRQKLNSQLCALPRHVLSSYQTGRNR
jgi:hypothetical protein